MHPGVRRAEYPLAGERNRWAEAALPSLRGGTSFAGVVADCLPGGLPARNVNRPETIDFIGPSLDVVRLPPG